MKKLDFIIISLILLISIISLFIINIFKNEGSKVIVKIDNTIYNTYDLHKNGIYILNEGTNILIIENGYAYIKEANCKNQLCTKHHKINKEGEAIICLPNKIVIYISGNDNVDITN